MVRLQYYYYYYPGGIQEKNDNEYELFMRVDKLEDTGNGYDLYLDGINKEFFDSQSGRFDILEQGEKLSTYSVVVNYSKEREEELNYFKKRPSRINNEAVNEYRWYLVSLTSTETEIPAFFFLEDSLEPEPQKLYIKSFQKIPYSDYRDLTQLNSQLTQFISVRQRNPFGWIFRVK